MDNFTHTLVGLFVAESFVQFEASKKRPISEYARSALLGISAIANNIPDIDVAYTGITPGKLGYLLHHRGHTHTLLFSLPQSVVLFALFLIYARWRKREFQEREKRWLLISSIFGPLIHILLDAMNSYGVHPFWPLDSRWIYGDFIFIMEPWFWISILSALAFVQITKKNRNVYLALLGATLTIVWLHPFLTWYVSILLSVWSLIIVASYRLLTPQRSMLVAGLGLLAVLGSFFVASRVLKSSIHREQKLWGDFELKDVVLNPAPANPLCWSVLTIENQREGTEMRYRRGMATLIPAPWGVDQCPKMRMGEGAAPLREIPSDRSHQWTGEFVFSRSELANLASEHCAVREFLRFARAPFFVEQNGEYFVGDFRYDFSRMRGFSTFVLNEGTKRCPPFVPGWTPPRSDCHIFPVLK